MWASFEPGGDPPRWAAPQYLEADGRPIRIMAGPNGSMQGPAEAKWGYTTLSVADWDGDGLPDLIVNSIWGKVVWYRNVGTRTQPKLAPPQPIEVQWPAAPPKPAWNWWKPAAKELVTQWRTTPVVCDLNGDGLADLVMLDPEGFLALFRASPPRRAVGAAAGPAGVLRRERLGVRRQSQVRWPRPPAPCGSTTARRGEAAAANSLSPTGTATAGPTCWSTAAT